MAHVDPQPLPAQQQVPQLSVVATLSKVAVVGDPRCLTVTLTNTGDCDIRPGWLKVPGSGAWYGTRVDLTAAENALAPGESLDVELVQEPRWGASIRYVTQKDAIEYSSVPAEKFDVEIPLFGCAEGLRCTHPTLLVDGRRPQFGILGLMGAGKTSFLNTVSTVFNSAHGFTKPFACGNGAQTHTTQLTSLVLPNFTVTDSYGLERGRWPAEHLRLFLEGVIPDGTAMERVASLTEREIAKLRKTAWKRRMDGVIFCVPATLVHYEPSHPEVVAAITAFEAIRHACPVIALTKADEADPVFANASDYESAEAKAAGEALKAKAAALFRVEARRVVPVVSYRNEAERSFALDKAVMTLMETALRCADDAAEQRFVLASTFAAHPEAWSTPGWTWHNLLTKK